MFKEYKINWEGRELTVKTGKIALQANSAVIVQYGETSVLATVVKGESRDGVDFLPLMVDFEEKLYAAGIIKGSRWIKREGRPSDDSVLTGRMIDRTIRPLFNQDITFDIQVLLSVLSVDNENDHDIVSFVAASTALLISGIDWRGPVGGVRIGRVNGDYIVNPTYSQRDGSDLDLIVASTEGKVIMIEAGAQEITEDDFYKAIKIGQKAIQPLIGFMLDIKKEVGKSDVSSNEKPEADENIISATNWLDENIKETLFNKEYYKKNERKAAVKEIKKKLKEFLGVWDKKVESLVEKKVELEVTKAIIDESRRVDGRGVEQIRKLSSEVSILPRVHGSSLFSRGETQVMSIVTLASPGLYQMLEGVEGQSNKYYIHHYNFPPFCVGEAKPLRSAGRREIGHGALAEKAIIPVLPGREEFPYTIRVVSETLGSNGSSSMGSVCASSLALMDAGVPIKKAVAGIAMGLASNDDMSQYRVITDLQDLEDGKGGMDFKVAGTVDGITAVQLDTKTDGLNDDIILTALKNAKKARLEILEVMNGAIELPRPEISQYAPRVEIFKINPEKIGEVVGSGGKTINKIIAEFEVTIDIEDDGTVMVSGVDQEKTKKAVVVVKNIAKDFIEGEIFKGLVTRVDEMRIFVKIGGLKDGAVHVSDMAPFRLPKPADLVREGQEVTVCVKEVDERGRLNLTMKNMPENKALWDKYLEKNQNRSNDRVSDVRKPFFKRQS